MAQMEGQKLNHGPISDTQRSYLRYANLIIEILFQPRSYLRYRYGHLIVIHGPISGTVYIYNHRGEYAELLKHLQ